MNDQVTILAISSLLNLLFLIVSDQQAEKSGHKLWIVATIMFTFAFFMSVGFGLYFATGSANQNRTLYPIFTFLIALTLTTVYLRDRKDG